MSITSKASGTWSGGLKDGQGTVSLGSGALSEVPVTFATRFEGSKGCNPEELIAGAHASCYSMAFSAELEKAGFKATRVETTAQVNLDKDPAGGFRVHSIELDMVGEVPDIDAEQFQTIAEAAKNGCPISKLLRPGVDEIHLSATLR